MSSSVVPHERKNGKGSRDRRELEELKARVDLAEVVAAAGIELEPAQLAAVRPAMTRAELDDLKGQLDLVEVIRQSGVTLKRSGKSYKGLCPFHAEDSPSFLVTPEAGLFNCFGCQAGGDIFRFFQLKKKCSFPEAVAHVRELVGEPSPTNGQPKTNGKLLAGSMIPTEPGRPGPGQSFFWPPACWAGRLEIEVTPPGEAADYAIRLLPATLREDRS